MVFFARCAHVVEATQNGQTEYWAVTTHRDDVLTVVGSQVGLDWNLALTGGCLTGQQAAELKMMHNSVRKLNTPPDVGCRALQRISHLSVCLGNLPVNGRRKTPCGPRLSHGGAFRGTPRSMKQRAPALRLGGRGTEALCR
jgi:hypothetical protein